MMGCFFVFRVTVPFSVGGMGYALNAMPERLSLIWQEFRFSGSFPGIPILEFVYVCLTGLGIQIGLVEAWQPIRFLSQDEVGLALAGIRRTE